MENQFKIIQNQFKIAIIAPRGSKKDAQERQEGLKWSQMLSKGTKIEANGVQREATYDQNACKICQGRFWCENVSFPGYFSCFFWQKMINAKIDTKKGMNISEESSNKWSFFDCFLDNFSTFCGALFSQKLVKTLFLQCFREVGFTKNDKTLIKNVRNIWSKTYRKMQEQMLEKWSSHDPKMIKTLIKNRCGKVIGKCWSRLDPFERRGDISAPENTQYQSRKHPLRKENIQRRPSSGQCT